MKVFVFVLADPPMKTVDQTSIDEFKDLLNLNLVNYFIFCKVSTKEIRRHCTSGLWDHLQHCQICSKLLPLGNAKCLFNQYRLHRIHVEQKRRHFISLKSLKQPVYAQMRSQNHLLSWETATKENNVLTWYIKPFRAYFRPKPFLFFNQIIVHYLS